MTGGEMEDGLVKNSVKANQSREYLTNIYLCRSVLSLSCSILSLMFAFYGIIAGFESTIRNLGRNIFFSFAYFTMISNMLATLSATFMIPFAVEGIRKKRFTVPRWVAVFHFTSTSAITTVMILVLAVMSWSYPESAFGGSNLATHVICPTLILISYFQIENGYSYSLRDRLFACIPFFVYTVVYYIEVVMVGEASGGWPDIYHICGYVSSPIVIPLLFLFGFGIASLIALVSNKLTKSRDEKAYQCWKDDTDPIEVRIEVFGLGRMAGLNGEKNNVQIPFDIIERLALKYDLNMDDLSKPFITGYLNGVKERKTRQGPRLSRP